MIPIHTRYLPGFFTIYDMTDRFGITKEAAQNVIDRWIKSEHILPVNNGPYYEIISFAD